MDRDPLWPERWPGPQVQRGFLSSSHSGASKTPRGGCSWLSDVPTLRHPNEGVQGLPGTRQLLPRLLRSQSPRTPATAPAERQPTPPPPPGSPGAAECRLRTRRHVGSPAALRCARSRSGSAQPPRARRGPCRCGERSSPCHFAPVGGNLRSVTLVLKRATCSAGLAAPGGTAGLGRRGVGTLGSGGHAGVGARRRPAPAAR